MLSWITNNHFKLLLLFLSSSSSSSPPSHSAVISGKILPLLLLLFSPFSTKQSGSVQFSSLHIGTVNFEFSVSNVVYGAKNNHTVSWRRSDTERHTHSTDWSFGATRVVCCPRCDVDFCQQSFVLLPGAFFRWSLKVCSPVTPWFYWARLCWMVWVQGLFRPPHRFTPLC